jgi:hypothetical protein
MDAIGKTYPKTYPLTQLSTGTTSNGEMQPSGTDEAMWIQDPITLTQAFHSIFEFAGIMYYVSGDVASSIHGEARSTRELDLVIQIPQGEVEALMMTLQSSGFYCPEEAVEEIKQLRSRMPHVTHIETIALSLIQAKRLMLKPLGSIASLTSNVAKIKKIKSSLIKRPLLRWASACLITEFRLVRWAIFVRLRIALRWLPMCDRRVACSTTRTAVGMDLVQAASLPPFASLVLPMVI